MVKPREFHTQARWRVRFLCGLFWLLAAGSAGAQGGIPENLEMADRFSPGMGAPIGEVRLLQGRAVVVHDGEEGIGFPLARGGPLFQGDTIFTGPQGKVNLELKDGSQITLATNTRMTLDRSVYNPEALKTRSSFVRVVFGKARFLVRKISGLVSSDFTVKTETAIVGVRGSDFAVEVTESATTVTAFEETQIDVIGLVVPCPRVEERRDLEECQVTPTRLRDFEQALVRKGDFPQLLGTLAPERIEVMKQEFIIEGGAGLRTERPEEPEIRVAEGALSDLATGTPQVTEETSVPDAFMPGEEGAAIAGDDAATVIEDQAEEVLDEELERLPGFPVTPNRVGGN